MTAEPPDLRLREALRHARTVERRGRVVQAFGTTIRVTGLDARIGQECDILDAATGARIRAEVVGLQAGEAILTPLSSLNGLSVDADVVAGASRTEVLCGDGLLGRVVDAFGAPLDGLGPIEGDLTPQPVYADAPNPLSRTPINDIFPTGVRAVDCMLSVGVGQRVGVFATAGGGKSTLLGMFARHCAADVNVIVLIGERGREVREFLEDSLGPEGMARSVVVVATSDRPAMERVRAAHVATAMAESFRARGLNVMLQMDSVTRFARALREIGLSVGEPAVRRGFPPSVFAELPRLFERAGSDDQGAITAFYTVLLEDEDGGDPIGEEVRSILDGHIYLSRKLGQAGHYPAIDIAGSLSRVFPRISDAAHQAAAAKVRAWMSRYAEIEFLLQIGEYKPGGDPLADEAIARMPSINGLLRQSPNDREPVEGALAKLQEVAA
jgi:type III secretion protein N (ATPase)